MENNLVDDQGNPIESNFYQDIHSGVCYSVKQNDSGKMIITASSDGYFNGREFPKHFNERLKPIYAEGEIEQMRHNASWLEKQLGKTSETTE